MKKKIGWFFIILGILNLFRSLAMFSYGTDNAGGILMFGIIILELGAWMVSSSKSKDSKDNK